MGWGARARGCGRACLTMAAWIAAIGACGWTPAAAAQTAVTTGTISGQIKDTTGSILPGVTVTATRLETNRASATTSGADGRYRFLSLDVGVYRVTAALQGFKTTEASITLNVGATIDVSLVMQPSVSETVSVTGEALAVEVARTQAAETVRPEEIQSLPLNGRNYLDLALLTPGVSRTNTGAVQRFAETSAVPGTGISVASQRNINNTFLVDGLSANDDAAELAVTFYSQEVIREFQVISGGGMAEFGRAAGGIINVVTKSGTNDWHGDGYGFFRGRALNAANALTHRVDPFNQQQTGGSIAGPIRRDRAFMFVNVEHTHAAQTGLVTIAPAAVTAIDDTLAARGYSGAAVATGSFETGYDATNVFARMDAALDASSRLTARASTYDVTSPNSRNAGGLSTVSRGTGLHDADVTGAVNLLTTMSSDAINELRAQYTRSRLDAPVNDPLGPAVSIAGVATFGTSTSSPTARDLDVFEISDTLTRQRGAHLFKVGADALLNRLDVEFPGATVGSYAFSSLASFQSGAYTTYQQAFGDVSQFQSNPNLAVFAQDEWHAGRDVTVNAGLRYDVQWLPSPIQADLNNVSPRLGVAWAPGDRRTIVRASGGLYFNPIPLRATSNALQRDGSKYQVAVYSFGQAGAPAFPATLPAIPSGLLLSVTTIDPHIQDGVSRQAAVQVERQLGHATSVTVGYERLGGHQIIMQRNVNAPTLSASAAADLHVANLGRPNPDVANIARYESIGDSRYDGVTVSLQTRRRSFDARASYTYSRAYDDAGNFFFSQPQDNSDVRADWGPSDNDQRHRLTLSGGVQSPALTGSFAHRLAARWRLSGILSATSALPFNVQTGTDRNNDTNNNDRPLGVGRNSARGFDFASLDLRLTRTIAIGRSTLDVMFEGFNVLNRANDLVPNNVFGTGATPLATFGQPTAVNDPRELQFGVRINF